MKLADFFKPTITKIVLFVLIPVFYAQVEQICGFAGSCFQFYYFLPLILALFSYIKFYWQSNIILHIIFGAIVSYLISCLIISLYHKIKNQKKLKGGS